MGWVKVKWIPQLFAAFDTLWPDRNRSQDGTIGDRAHQASKSGHNPDDTPGSLAEREDADNIPEVRAADVDARGVNMQAVVNAIVSDPNERKRFIYIIFDGWIYPASNGWKKTRYTGSDQHTTHAHFSGDPNYDEDARPFAFMGEDMNLNDKSPWTQQFTGEDGYPKGPWLGGTMSNQLQYVREDGHFARAAAVRAAAEASQLRTEVTELRSAVAHLVDLVTAIGNGAQAPSNTINGTYQITKVTQ